MVFRSINEKDFQRTLFFINAYVRGLSNMNNHETNIKILSHLAVYLNFHPEIRFHQALQNLNITIPNTDQFYEESNTTLERIPKND